jgi:TonB family protein
MRSCIFFILLITFLSSIVVFAQDIACTIRGSVKDDFGRPIIDATVTTKDEEDQVIATVKTDKDGNYEVADLPIGSYKLTVESEGLKSEEIKDIKLTVAAEQTFDLKLKTSLEGKAVKKIPPTYPEVAKLAQQQGRVVVGILVKPDGTVDKVLFLSGNAIFKAAALQAAQKWTFQKSSNGLSGRIAFNFKAN